MDTISVFVGVLIGVVATAFAVEFGLKKLFRPPARTKVTAAWRLDEFQAPLVVTMDPAAVEYPRGAQVVTSGSAETGGGGDRTFRRNANARANFAIDSTRDRALFFGGPVERGTLALSTTDPELVGRLRAEHRRLWETGEAYVEDLPLAQVAARIGAMVRTRGRVVEVVPYRGRHLLRLVDGDQAIGVLVDSALDLAGAEVVVVGRAARGASGYPLLDAEEVRRVAPVETPRRAPPTRAPTPAPRTAPVAAPPPSPPAEPEPTMAFEEVTSAPHVSEAERRKVRAKVVLRH